MMTSFEHLPPARLLRRLIAVALGTALTATPALAANGRRVYVDMGCQVCHGEMGYGGVGPAFHKNPFLALPDYLAARVLLGGGAMPSFAHRLSDDEIAAVITYLRQRWHAAPNAIAPKDVTAVRNTVMQGASATTTAQDVGPAP
jgi:mono/diheme cytochrome c family protein